MSLNFLTFSAKTALFRAVLIRALPVLNKEQLKNRTKNKKINIKIKIYKKIPDINSEDPSYPSNKESQRTITVIHLSIEGLTRAKSDFLSKMFKDVDVLALQETHVPDGETRRLKISGFNMIDYRGHHKHGLATYVNKNIEETNVVSIAGNEHSIGTRIGNLTIYNVTNHPRKGGLTQCFQSNNPQRST